MQLFAGELTNQNREYSKVNDNKRNHSTETLNTYITDNILESMDQTALILIDLS